MKVLWVLFIDDVAAAVDLPSTIEGRRDLLKFLAMQNPCRAYEIRAYVPAGIKHG